ncbi:peptidoglycan editing factor PgeF [Lachnospiraceae bacterium ZAX-1]
MEFIKKNQEEILTLREYKVRLDLSVPLLIYKGFSDTGFVKHCFTTRRGGCSEGIYASMNLSFTRGDQTESVKENFRRIADAMNVDYNKFVFADQTHTTNIRAVTESDAGHGITKKKNFFDVDGLITNVPGLVLATFYADCVPLYFLDPVNKAIGLSHSGWRGTRNRMGRATIEAMRKAYGTRAEDLMCAIGPSICRDCYEVGEEVAEQFLEEFKSKAEELLWEKRMEEKAVSEGIDGTKVKQDVVLKKYQLDLWRANEIVLEEAGVIPTNIATTNICTCCNAKLLFSHRASQGKRGNLGAFLSLNDT